LPLSEKVIVHTDASAKEIEILPPNCLPGEPFGDLKRCTMVELEKGFAKRIDTPKLCWITTGDFPACFLIFKFIKNTEDKMKIRETTSPEPVLTKEELTALNLELFPKEYSTVALIVLQKLVRQFHHINMKLTEFKKEFEAKLYCRHCCKEILDAAVEAFPGEFSHPLCFSITFRVYAKKIGFGKVYYEEIATPSKLCSPSYIEIKHLNPIEAISTLMPWISGKLLEIFCIFHNIPAIIATLKQDAALIPMQKHQFVIRNVGSHWVAVQVICKNDNKQFYYYDPISKQCSPEKATANFKFIESTSDLTCTTKVLVDQGSNGNMCGRFVALAVYIAWSFWGSQIQRRSR
jgi:hypothetical protein